MLDYLIPNLQCRDAIELLVVDTDEADPLLSALLDRLLQTFRICVELERVRVKSIDLDRPAHRPNIDASLNPPNDDAVGQGPVDKIHALKIELEHGLALNLGPVPRSQLEEAGEASNGAVSDHEAPRNEDGVKEVERDFAVAREPFELGESVAIVGGDSGGQEVHGAEHVALLICTTLFGLEGRSIREELGVEGYEEFGIQLCMRLRRDRYQFVFIGLTSRGSEFQEIPGHDWMTSLQALSIYSLLTTSLNVGSLFSCLAMVRTILNIRDASDGEEVMKTFNGRTRS